MWLWEWVVAEGGRVDGSVWRWGCGGADRRVAACTTTTLHPHLMSAPVASQPRPCRHLQKHILVSSTAFVSVDLSLLCIPAAAAAPAALLARSILGMAAALGRPAT